jgi:RNA polymerase sigma factor (sigma-70 family)
MTIELTDAQLVERCRAGSQEAWNELVERFSRYVYAIAVRGFRLPESDAEDVFQDVFARTFERLNSLRDDTAIRPWLAQLTRNACVDRLRAGTREQPTEEPLADDVDGEIERLDEALDVHEGLQGLSPNCREVLDRFDRARPFAPWLHRIVTNRALDWARARNIRDAYRRKLLNHFDEFWNGDTELRSIASRCRPFP